MSRIEGIYIEKRGQVYLANLGDHFISNQGLIAGNFRHVIEFFQRQPAHEIYHPLTLVNLSEPERQYLEGSRSELLQPIIERMTILGRVLSEIE